MDCFVTKRTFRLALRRLSPFDRFFQFQDALEYELEVQV